jgi:NADPH:quinone reductase-like Zn-dependent oxidoreductase
MKAIVCTKHGPADGLQLKQVEKPALDHNGVLVRIHAVAVMAGDWTQVPSFGLSPRGSQGDRNRAEEGPSCHNRST